MQPEELRRVLEEIGRITVGRFNQNLYFGAGNYHLGLLKNALKYKVNKNPTGVPSDITYKIDSGEPELDKIAKYFEYGTGAFNTRYAGSHIVPNNQKFMRFKGKKGKWVTAKQVKGVRAIFMMTKAIKSVENEWDLRVQRAKMKLGIK
jgi:hypothetical protein